MEVAFMEATATELKNNLGHYLKIAQKEDVRVIKNGRYVARLTSPRTEKVEKALSLFGIAPDTLTLEEAQAARLARYESTD
jgi:prevent-host-death family protein